ncbi:ABC transporter permease subunit [Austwickia chelonae]|uniref:ABC transporter permease subunit n=1 Tax=Austwickia chelonae TaxID=100225 RepID=UPI000E21E22D|nr:ABC transporter permease subunit [Austwickia chelonae]
MSGFTHLLKRALQAQQRDLLLWGGSVLLLVVSVLAVWPPLRDSGSLGSLTAGMTPEMAQAMGLDGFGTATGYLKGNLFAVILPLLIGFMGISGISGLLSGDERSGRLEILLSLPVRRWTVALSRLCAVVVVLLLTSLPMAASVILGARWLDMDVDTRGVLAVTTAIFLLGFFHAALAFLCACAGASKGAVSGTAGGVLVAGYVVQAVVALVPDLRWSAKLSPWEWALGGDPLVNGWQGAGLLLLLLTGAACLAVGCLFIERRDIANA